MMLDLRSRRGHSDWLGLLILFCFSSFLVVSVEVALTLILLISLLKLKSVVLAICSGLALTAWTWFGLKLLWRLR